MALENTPPLSIKNTSGINRSIAQEVDGDITGNKSLLTLGNSAGKLTPVSILDFLGYVHPIPLVIVPDHLSFTAAGDPYTTNDFSIETNTTWTAALSDPNGMIISWEPDFGGPYEYISLIALNTNPQYGPIHAEITVTLDGGFGSAVVDICQDGATILCSDL